jgi:large subunit ribosomal protein L15
MKLNQIADNQGARKIRTRVGRGIGSGLGKTAGRGGKGQTARKGGAKAGFEGGQMPIYRRLPKRGFNKPNAVEYNEVNLARIQAAIDSKKLDGKSTITAASLLAAGVISKRTKGGVRLIGKEKFTSKLEFEVFYATAGAKAAVEKAGGTVKILRPPKEEANKAAKQG